MARKTPTSNGMHANGSGGAMPARRQLARMLRADRLAAGITQEDAAEYIGRSDTTLYKIENAIPGVRIKPNVEIRLLCELYNVTDEDKIETLKQLAIATTVKGPYQPYRDVITGEFDMYLGLEGDAEELVTFESDLVPGLLQTEAYARALVQIPGKGKPRNEDEIDKRVRLRLERQSVLRRESNPLALDVILSEPVLRRPLGGHAVMADQLRHINDVGKLPNVTVRVAPLSPDPHLGLDTGPFVILRFPGEEPPIAFSDGFLGDNYFKEQEEIDRYEEAFENIAEHALSARDSCAFIERVAKEHIENE